MTEVALSSIFIFHVVPTSTPKISKKHDNSYTPLNQFIENNDNLDANKSADSIDTTSSSETRKKKRISLSSSISKVFSRGKSRRSLTLPPDDPDGW